jgi:ribosomal protein S18 acetylase RimI-like enzyme
MHIRSVGLATDLELAATRGTITDRGNYLVVETPDDPDYYFGNMLVLPAAPQVGEVGFWSRTFVAELGSNPAIRHVTLRWDGIAGDLGAAAELQAAGFKLERSEVLTARSITAPPIALEIRPLTTREVTQTAELEFVNGEHHDDAYRRFLQRRAIWKQSLVATGKAMWFGAFDHGELVGALGIVALGTRARYQDVQTATAYRKRGIASALLAAAARELLPSVEELVIVAEADGAAARLYQRLGFTSIERVAAAVRYPRIDN